MGLASLKITCAIAGWTAYLSTAAWSCDGTVPMLVDTISIFLPVRRGSLIRRRE
jgi:hypothetical protein